MQGRHAVPLTRIEPSLFTARAGQTARPHLSRQVRGRWVEVGETLAGIHSSDVFSAARFTLLT